MLAELLSVWWWLLNSTFVYVSPPRKESGTNESYLNLWLDRGCGCHIKPSRTLLISYDNSPWINKKNFDIIMPVYLNSLCAKVNQLSVSFGANKDATNFHCCVAFWQRIWLALVVPKRETFNATSEDKEPVWNRHQQWDWQKKNEYSEPVWICENFRHPKAAPLHSSVFFLVGFPRCRWQHPTRIVYAKWLHANWW